MCIKKVGVPEHDVGIMFKVVRRHVHYCEPASSTTDPPTQPTPKQYTPIYPAFYKNGTGGTFHTSSRWGVQATKVKYRIGQTTVVYHNKLAQATGRGEGTYRAGIHGWLTYGAALEYFSILRDGIQHLTIIKCSYEKAVAQDEDCIVALQITPLMEL